MGHWEREESLIEVLHDLDGLHDCRRTEDSETQGPRIIVRTGREQATYDVANLVSSAEFASILWLLFGLPKDAPGLRNPVGIAAFLFESLCVSGNQTRLRTSLLRWHPDTVLCLSLALVRDVVRELALASRVIERKPWLCAVTRRQVPANI
ncbi:hypothetical protein DFH11DRAFT_1244545 [Phellopilus nigrolimitatus]|nr:hypothetical protein DFH11DRAFT_1244545 [Phellopilus nigrolimitatus]